FAGRGGYPARRRRWIGWGPALIGGMLFVILPDNVRVALAEGNLPRVLATALLPFTFYCLLASLTPGGSRLSRVGLVLGFSAITLSHVMMAAIYAVCLSSWVLAAWVWRRTGFRDALLAILWIASGLALTGWWLLPSLTG
ncbi:MAG TPA: 6-pyruvoyl-tetrahydropterin synthase-related protein, partial [Anaerolineales bacterium]|nr:6-pyruvoyl-tetrahydropterin synthase-related protein [Anaerolineales bacterium]